MTFAMAAMLLVMLALPASAHHSFSAEFDSTKAVTLDDPLTYSRPWTIEMPLYRVIEDNAQLLEHKCVPFTDMLLYHDLLQNEKKE